MKRSDPIQKALLLFVLSLTSCGPSEFKTEDMGSLSSTSFPAYGNLESSARIIFDQNYFTQLDQFVTSEIQTSRQCLGDVLKTFYVQGGDYRNVNAQVEMPIVDPNDAIPTFSRPLFLKNVSLDMTNTYHPTTAQNVMVSDDCSYRGVTTAPDPNFCADFDRTPAAAPTPVVTAAATPMPTPTGTPYYETGFYRVIDEWCQHQGPVLDADIEVTKARIGGVNIDIDRQYLGQREDLLMNLTYLSINKGMDGPSPSQVPSWPKNPDPLLAVNDWWTPIDHTILRVKLIGTGETLNTLMGARQPRAWADFQSPSHTLFAEDIETLEFPDGGVRTEQVLIPLSQNALIDRVRIERIRGSFFLFQVDLYRMGDRTPRTEGT